MSGISDHEPLFPTAPLTVIRCSILGVSENIIYEHSGKYYAELLDMVTDGLVPKGFSIDTDGYHEIMNMIARDYKLEYRRTKR